MSYLSRDTASLSCFNKSALGVRLNLLLPPQGTYDFTGRKDTRTGIKLLNPGRKRRRERKRGEGGSHGPGLPEINGREGCRGERRRGRHPGVAPVMGGASGHHRLPHTLPPPRLWGHNARRPRPGAEKVNILKRKKNKEKIKPLFGANWAGFGHIARPVSPGGNPRRGRRRGCFSPVGLESEKRCWRFPTPGWKIQFLKGQIESLKGPRTGGAPVRGAGTAAAGPPAE